MTPVRLRAALAMVLMLAAVLAAHAWRPSVHLVDQRAVSPLESVFPKQFGGWVIDERMPITLISPDTQAVLNRIYSETLSRTYVNRSGERIMLSVAYGGDQSDATRAHRPEVCYPAQGFQLLSSKDGSIPVIGRQLRVRQLVSRLGARVEPISYWIVVGDRVALSGTDQKLAQLSFTTRGVIPDGMLVRVSSIDADSERAFSVQRGFIEQMAQAMPTEARARVLGKEGS